jgi:hypothetical protein
VLLGVVGAVALLIQVPGDQLLPGRGQGVVPGEDWLPLIWVSALALIAPAAAAVAVPRQFGLALLAGWIGCGIAAVTFYTGFQVSLFGYTLLALLAVIIPFARAATRKPGEQAARIMSFMAASAGSHAAAPAADIVHVAAGLVSRRLIGCIRGDIEMTDR